MLKYIVLDRLCFILIISMLLYHVFLLVIYYRISGFKKLRLKALLASIIWYFWLEKIVIIFILPFLFNFHLIGHQNTILQNSKRSFRLFANIPLLYPNIIHLKKLLNLILNLIRNNPLLINLPQFFLQFKIILSLIFIFNVGQNKQFLT